MPESKTRVLLVEDSAPDARLLRELLAEVPRQPFRVSVSGTLAEAIAAVADNDAVLLDLSLPDAHGLSTISRMVEAAGPAPVIVLTGNTDDDVAVQAVSLGADDYLLKSEITPSLVARTILYAIERRRGIEKTRQVLALEIARAESQRTAERARTLGDLSETFATKPDLDGIIETVSRCLVPDLADYCIVDLAKTDQELERARVHAGSAELVAPAQGLQPFTPRHHTHPIVRAMKERRAIFIPDVPAALDEMAVDEAHRDAVAALGANAALVLPLVARDRVAGALTLVLRRGRSLDGDHRVLAEEIARRAAVAIDNALLYRAMQRALRARDEMMAIVSHDLRNPLSVLALTLQVIRRDVEERCVPSPELISKGTRAIKRMERLVNDLLDVACIDAGTLVMRPAQLDLAAVLAESIEQNTPLAATKRIAICTRFDGDAGVEADRDRLLQAVANLLGNAIKFTPNGGTIEVSCIRRAGAVRVSIVDSGPGIAPESLPRVFERFYQLDKRREGVGLGLTIAKGIIAEHGGTIGVESEPGKGACFWFELPARSSGMEAVA